MQLLIAIGTGLGMYVQLTPDEARWLRLGVMEGGKVVTDLLAPCKGTFPDGVSRDWLSHPEVNRKIALMWGVPARDVETWRRTWDCKRMAELLVVDAQHQSPLHAIQESVREGFKAAGRAAAFLAQEVRDTLALQETATDPNHVAWDNDTRAWDGITIVGGIAQGRARQLIIEGFLETSLKLGVAYQEEESADQATETSVAKDRRLVFRKAKPGAPEAFFRRVLKRLGMSSKTATGGEMVMALLNEVVDHFLVVKPGIPGRLPLLPPFLLLRILRFVYPNKKGDFYELDLDFCFDVGEDATPAKAQIPLPRELAYRDDQQGIFRRGQWTIGLHDAWDAVSRLPHALVLNVAMISGMQDTNWAGDGLLKTLDGLERLPANLRAQLLHVRTSCGFDLLIDEYSGTIQARLAADVARAPISVDEVLDGLERLRLPTTEKVLGGDLGGTETKCLALEWRAGLPCIVAVASLETPSKVSPAEFFQGVARGVLQLVDQKHDKGVLGISFAGPVSSQDGAPLGYSSILAKVNGQPTCILEAKADRLRTFDIVALMNEHGLADSKFSCSYDALANDATCLAIGAEAMRRGLVQNQTEGRFGLGYYGALGAALLARHAAAQQAAVRQAASQPAPAEDLATGAAG